ncbi:MULTISPECIES: hypothetical protein [unclassified Microcoleus]|uniref:hypothetical protein n=1 Tax=unclassified Microcoleus TaxID=2642155 RepID=UPI002FD78BB1
MIVSKNQGIYVPVNQHPTQLSVWAALNDGLGDWELNITVSNPWAHLVDRMREPVCSLHLQEDLRCCDNHSTLAEGINDSVAFWAPMKALSNPTL